MLNGCTSLDDYITRHQVDGVMWKAEKLLANIDNAIHKNDAVEAIAHTLALIPKPIVRETYGKKIGKLYDISWPTFKGYIENHLAIHKRKESAQKAAIKNIIPKLDGDPSKWQFFTEKIKTTKDGDEIFAGIDVDIFKFIQLLKSFGFARFEKGVEITRDEEYHFVKLEDNVIQSVNRSRIIDHFEKFLLTEYDFEGAKCTHVNAVTLLNKFYKEMRSLFHKDIFGRLRTEKDIIINRDEKGKTFFYYQNGFVEVTKDGWKLCDYQFMPGSIWEDQINQRNFVPMDPKKESDMDEISKGMYADFCYRISGEREDRFTQLCEIMGYVLHDYYEYKLKSINLTDSSLSEDSDGRSGKTLWAKMMGYAKGARLVGGKVIEGGVCEINGKDFDASNERKYQSVKMSTQTVVLNDLQTKGRNKFFFDDVFNDITEGFMVKKLYLSPFRHQAKFIMLSNKTLNIRGGSQRDRILEFETSQFFSENYSPEQHYKAWFGRDWNEGEWQLFDNFICLCSMWFHNKMAKDGKLESPVAINLDQRKLIDHTSREFINFMDDCRKNVTATGKPFDNYQLDELKFEKDFSKFSFNKKFLYKEFVRCNEDFDWLKQNTFNKWLEMFAQLGLKIKEPHEWRSNGIDYIQFGETKKEKS